VALTHSQCHVTIIGFLCTELKIINRKPAHRLWTLSPAPFRVGTPGTWFWKGCGVEGKGEGRGKVKFKRCDKVRKVWFFSSKEWFHWDDEPNAWKRIWRKKTWVSKGGAGFYQNERKWQRRTQQLLKILHFKKGLLLYLCKNFKVKLENKNLAIPYSIWDKTSGLHIL
jgi:hypothetical protein